MADILSVGIDVGTSTTQVVFSRIKMMNTAGYFAVPNVSIVDKQIVYRGQVRITPLKNEYMLDADKLRQIVQKEYELAGFSPSDTDTGAVIITGESARKENAAVILEKLSDFAGEFVVSTAGPDLESVLAGKGSGAYSYSLTHNSRVANLDIGGGTTNIAVFDCGDVAALGCYDIGGRLVRVSSTGTIEYVSPAAEKILEYLGYKIRVGDNADLFILQRLSEKMAELIGQCLGFEPEQELLRELATQHSSQISSLGTIDAVCFSGGVADCMHQAMRPFEFGDIGVLLGQAIKKAASNWHVPVINSSETIRATVVGAGTYTTDISGSTISYCPDLLPIKNLPALRLSESEQEEILQPDAQQYLIDRIHWFVQQCSSGKIVLSLPGLFKS